MIHSIPKDELRSRHEQIHKLLTKNQALLILSNQVFLRNGDTDYRFRQDSNFWYFTGFDEDQAGILFLDGKIYLFAKEKNELNETWTGKIAGLKEAKLIVGADEVFPFEKLCEIVTNKTAKFKKIFFDHEGNSFVKLRDELNDILIDGQIKVQNESNLTSKLRMYKSNWEIQQMKQASKVSILAHQRIKQFLQAATTGSLKVLPFKTNQKHITENILHGILEYTFKEHATIEAYPPIVAGGKNAATLHYWQNNQKISQKDLILIDSGCEYNYYSSDITRVYSINKFTKPQQEIYNLVLKASQEIITLTSSHIHNNLTLQDLQLLSNQILTQGLIDLKILKEPLEISLKQGLYKKYYMHGISHWLGLDTHDQGMYKDVDNNPLVLKPRMCFTVEPGLYFKADDTTIPKEYRGIGIRIEDNIVLSETGLINLTEKLIK